MEDLVAPPYKGRHFQLSRHWDMSSFVVYFDKPTIALNNICWSKSSFSTFNIFFYHMQKKDEKAQKNTQKNRKRGYQHLG